MRVTCLCTCHNKPHLTHEAVESIVHQTHPDWEAIVVDSGVLYDAGYYERFPWRNDPRVKIVRSDETEETRRTKAMAPWCYNECFRKGRVTGDLVMYLCDDDLLYPNAFATFVAYCRQHPEAEAMYASQDIGVLYPNGAQAVIGERRATEPGGRCCGGRPMDCRVDYLQFCHKTSVLRHLPGDAYWPENKDADEHHADGLFMERIGAHVPIHPIDVKVSQNRRTPQSKYVPVPAVAGDGLELWAALAGLQRRVEQLTEQNAALQARLHSARYRVADRVHDCCARVPFAKRALQWLLSL